MKYNAPFGNTNEDASYINGNPETGTMGSIPPAASIEFPQREIVAMINDSGLQPDNAQLNQLARSIQSGFINFGEDGGTVNNLQVTMAPIPDYRDGLVVRARAAQSNTGPSVLNVNAKGPKRIIRRGNFDLLAGDIEQNSIADMTFNARLDAFELTGVGGGGVSGNLSKDLDLYVNYAIGNDANDGIAPDVAHALKNIQRAIDIAFTYGPGPYIVGIHVADSPYYQPWVTPDYLGPTIYLLGNPAAPGNVVVTGGNGVYPGWARGGNDVILNGFRHNGDYTSSSRISLFVASRHAHMRIYNCESGQAECSVFASHWGAIIDVYSHKYWGPRVGGIFWAGGNGILNLMAGSVHTVMNNYIAQCSVATATGNGTIYVDWHWPTWVNYGLVSGKKYVNDNNGVISVCGFGPNFFPGDRPGFCVTGGQYS